MAAVELSLSDSFPLACSHLETLAVLAPISVANWRWFISKYLRSFRSEAAVPVKAGAVDGEGVLVAFFVIFALFFCGAFVVFFAATLAAFFLALFWVFA